MQNDWTGHTLQILTLICLIHLCTFWRHRTLKNFIKSIGTIEPNYLTYIQLLQHAPLLNCWVNKASHWLQQPLANSCYYWQYADKRVKHALTLTVLWHNGQSCTQQPDIKQSHLRVTVLVLGLYIFHQSGVIDMAQLTKLRYMSGWKLRYFFFLIWQKMCCG